MDEAPPDEAPPDEARLDEAEPEGARPDEARLDGGGCPAVAEAGVVAGGVAGVVATGTGVSRGQAAITTVPPLLAALPPMPDRSAK